MTAAAAPHIPVLLEPILSGCSPITGVWVDGTFGAGGYSRGLLDAGAGTVHGFDRDPMVFDMAADWLGDYPGLCTVNDVFSNMAAHVDQVDGVVLDLGVSSMQIDQAERGFSFQKDGPLDMRMGGDVASAEEVVNTADEATLADILHHYGEERAARRIARAIVRVRAEAPITRTLQLADLVASCLPRSKPGQSHPATRSFQAIRIAVNDEFGELIRGLAAAERILKPEGWLAVVTFHSLEDRVVKRFLTARSDTGGGGSRYAPERAARTPEFIQQKRAIGPSDAELERNPRARSARLRLARRTDAPSSPIDTKGLALPKITDVEGI